MMHPGYLDPHRVRLNSDHRLRKLERGLQSGEIPPTPEVGYQLYVLHQQAGVELPEAGGADQVVETKHGLLRIHINDASTVGLQNRAQGWDASSSGIEPFEDPWTINRIPILFSQHAKKKAGKWVVEISQYGIYAVPPRMGWDPSSSLKKNLKKALEAALAKWAKGADELLAGADAASNRDKLDRLQNEVSKLQAKIADKQDRIGATYLRMLAASQGQPLPPRPDPQRLASRLTLVGDEIEQKATRLLNVSPHTLRGWGRTGDMTFAEEEAVIDTARRLGVGMDNPPRRKRRNPRRKR